MSLWPEAMKAGVKRCLRRGCRAGKEPSFLVSEPLDSPKGSRRRAACPPPPVIYQTQPGKWFLEALGLLAVEPPCPPLPPSRLPTAFAPWYPASAEDGDTLGQQRSAGSGLSLRRQAEGQHSMPVLGRPGAGPARRIPWVYLALEPSVLPSCFQWEAPVQGEAERLRRGDPTPYQLAAGPQASSSNVLSWTLRAKGSANYSLGRSSRYPSGIQSTSGQVSSPAWAGALPL